MGVQRHAELCKEALESRINAGQGAKDPGKEAIGTHLFCALFRCFAFTKAHFMCSRSCSQTHTLHRYPSDTACHL